MGNEPTKPTEEPKLPEKYRSVDDGTYRGVDPSKPKTRDPKNRKRHGPKPEIARGTDFDVSNE